MKRVDKVLLEMLDIAGPNTTELEVSKDLKVCINNFVAEENKEYLLEYCKSIPDEDLTGIHLFKTHTGQNRFLALMLMAFGEHHKIWDRFPSVKLPWNLSHFPCVVKAPKKRLKHIRYEEPPEEDSIED